MDPSLLKSIQQIEELVKNKKNIIEQIPIKSISVVEPPSLPKSNPITLPYTPQISNLPQNGTNILLNNQLNLGISHLENNLYMNRMNMQLNPINFNDGLAIPNQLEGSINPIFNENDRSNAAKFNQLSKSYFDNNIHLNFCKEPTKSQAQGDSSKKKTQQEKDQNSKDKKKKIKTLRKIAGESWEDKTLEDWPENDFRIFCGDLGNEVNDEVLATAFRKYSSFQRARVIRDKRSGKTKGYGFVSMMDPQEYLKALTEMNGKYVGNRPIKIRKSSWKDRAMFGGKFNNNTKSKKKIKIY